MTKEEFGTFLSEQRKEKAMTQTELAQKLYVSSAAVSKWERGLCLPDITKLEDLAGALGLSLAELLQCRKEPEIGKDYHPEQVQEVIRTAITISESENARHRKKMRRLRLILWGAVLLALTVLYLTYRRPTTLRQLCPEADLAQCSGIRVFYSIYTDPASDSRGRLEQKQESFRIGPEDPCFRELLYLTEHASLRARLKNLNPPQTVTYPVESGDFWWTLTFEFADPVEFPDGNSSGGDLITIENHFGNISICVPGSDFPRYFSVKNEAQWIEDMTTVIRFCLP